MRELRLDPEAIADVADISEYLDTVSGGSRAASNVLGTIAERLDYLCESPTLGGLREELGPGYRSSAAGQYVIYYRFTDTEVTVLHIAHGSRLAANVFKSSN